jgi:deazaflavin-dependent oxidoreductase (nitroreductase family)
MTDASSKAINDAAAPRINQHRDNYLRTGGAEGHIYDTSGAGGHVFCTHLLLKTIGRKSGKTYFTPLTYGDIGGEVAIIASKAGADHNPDWFENLRVRPEIEFQIATQAFRGSWRETDGAEREKLWAFMEEILPVYKSYKAATTRRIPLVMMKAVQAIPVFRPEELKK